MGEINDVDNEEIKVLIRKLLSLPSQHKSLAEFQKEEDILISSIESIVSDPYWMDYLSYPSRYQLDDCVAIDESGDISIDEVALEKILTKIRSFKATIL
jgi:hypothetical protein